MAPLYGRGAKEIPRSMQQLIAALRLADGIVIASPGYHGSISGAVKNALDYTEEMAGDDRPYFSSRGVGCIATAGDWRDARRVAQHRARTSRMADTFWG